MTTLEALWLGMVQGLTEFLPVSSSGHLVIFQDLLGIEGEGGLLFEVGVHVATLVAILAFYHKRVGALILGVLGLDPAAWRYGAKLAIATLPAVAVALGGGAALQAMLESPWVAGVCLIITGTILWTTRRTLPNAHEEEPGYGAAIVIGFAQAFAILPGISRSGTTVATALALGIAPVAAAEFSFLMGVVAIAGAAVLMVPELSSVSASQLSALSVGGAAALVSGIFAIWLFVLLLRKQSFYAFSYYTWAAGAAFLVWLSVR